MFSSEKEFLFLFGWDGFFESQSPNLVSSSLLPARVICEERNLYRVQWGTEDILWAQVSGKMQFSATSRADYPAVGDWVLIEIPHQSDRGVIHQIAPRKSVIQRKQVGSSVDMQILSTNVDYIFITTSMSDDLNYHRIERYLTVAWESGVVPIILLTKTDLCLGNIEELTEEVRQKFLGVDVYPLSKNGFEEAEFFQKYLKSGKTSVVVGSSGVGKSTLVNFLIGRGDIKTQEVREYDGKGRHTTTSRSLYVSRYGGLIIDTPGMRELQLLDHADGVQTQFADVESLILSCHFGDCQHLSEPNCAIKESLSDGTLSEDRWQSYHQLMAEVRHGLRKRDKVRAAEDRKLWKKKSIQARNNRRSRMGGM
jgi:ribosome biogenesis GTPase / thiamine phosphate phosphatase